MVSTKIKDGRNANETEATTSQYIHWRRAEQMVSGKRTGKEKQSSNNE